MDTNPVPARPAPAELYELTGNRGLDGVLTVRNGQVVVRTTWDESGSPTRVSQFWGPLIGGPDVEHVEAMGLDGTLAHHLPSGMFTLARWGTVRLPQGGSTVCLWVERQRVPPPRTKLTTRWLYGHWEKCHPKKGWVK
jgi:hypothetical protein